jgi:hypothetical protein
MTNRWVVDAGLRYEDGGYYGGLFLPRLAITYDLRGDGSRAVSATVGEYGYGVGSSIGVRVASLGYSATIGASGSIRADYLRREKGHAQATDSVQLDTRYRLFDRFEAGATYGYQRRDADTDYGNDESHGNEASAWISAELPVGSHAAGMTLLQRYWQPYNYYEPITIRSTDLALRYSVPFSRAGLLVALDIVNVLNSGNMDINYPRTLRLWSRVRL